MSTQRVGFIGTGNIGEPMVERLLSGGHPTTIYARKNAVRERLTARGAVIASTPEDLASSDLVAACLFTDDQVLEVCPSIISQMRPGSVFLSHTTGSPGTVRQLADIATGRGVSVVEAPFSGNPEAIRRGQLTVLLAGDDAAVDRAQSAVSTYASNIIRTGALGTAQPAKLLNNALFAVSSQMTLSALLAAKSLGISQETLLAVLAVSSGGNTAARYIAASGQDAIEYSERLPRYLRKDLASVRHVADELGVDISAILTSAQLGPMDLTERGPLVDHLEVSPS